MQRLRAIENDQQAAVGAQAAALQIGEQALTHRRVLRRAFPEAERVFPPGGVDAERDDDAVLADVDAVDQERHEIEAVERGRPPGGELRRRLRDEAAAHGALARAPAGHRRRQRLQTARILARRHAHEHLLDHAPIQRILAGHPEMSATALPRRRRARAAGEAPPCGHRARPRSGPCRRARPVARPDADSAGPQMAVRSSSSIVLRTFRPEAHRQLQQLGSWYRRADRRAADGAGRANRLGETDRLCETLSSWRLLVGGLSPGASHHSFTTSSEEPPLSNFNS